MDYQKAIKIVTDIEEQFDVNSVQYNGIKVWPLIRLTIWQLLQSPEANVTRPDHFMKTRISSCIEKNPFFNLFAEYILRNNAPKHQRQLDSLKFANNVCIAFFSHTKYHTERVKGKYYDRFIDPIIDLAREKYSFAKIETFLGNYKKTLPRYNPTVFLNVDYYLSANKKYLKEKFSNKILDQASAISNFSDLKRVVYGISNGINIDEEYFIKLMWIAEWHLTFYKEVLSHVKPRVVFLTCYYHLPAMALTKACKEMGITTVDLQHGSLGKYHGLYASWTKIPQEGYEFLPDFYWCWGEESKEYIEKWKPQDCSKHKAIVGGNQWIAKWVESDDFGPEEKFEEFYQSLGKSNRVILITCQEPEIPLPKHVLEAMQDSQDDWLWLLRMHPLLKQETAEMENEIHSYGIKNFEIRNATRAPLFSLLKRVNHHITCSSSASYEALAFKVPTTIIHSEGLQLYDNYIKDGIFGYAQTKEELLNSIKNSDFTKLNKESTPFIETSKKYANDALDYIIKSSEGVCK